GRAIGDVPFRVEHVVGADRGPMDVAQEREWNTARPRELRLAEGAIAADRQQRRPALAQLVGDLAQAGQLRRSDATPRVTEEGQDDVRVPTEFGEGHRAPEARGKRKLWSRLPVRERHGRDTIREAVPSQTPRAGLSAVAESGTTAHLLWSE